MEVETEGRFDGPSMIRDEPDQSQTTPFFDFEGSKVHTRTKSDVKPIL